MKSNLARLICMGFAKEKAIDALSYHNDFKRALDKLLSNYEAASSLPKPKPQLQQQERTEPEPTRLDNPDMKEALKTYDLKAFCWNIQIYFASFPYSLIDLQEKYFHSLLYAKLCDLFQNCEAEESTSGGRIDITVKTDRFVCLIEIKLGKSAYDALYQIEGRNYALKFHQQQKDIVCIGLNFDKLSKNLSEGVMCVYDENGRPIGDIQSFKVVLTEEQKSYYMRKKKQENFKNKMKRTKQDIDRIVDIEE
ncbi:unnamed protein product [Blepharisma stoltei]|uniref:UBA domain-containing protein n=1 Tax=Blepharisma stoltei TaxID=1481888 RepID=A0AAU9JZX0_9CILI|nr:unnamed protein product [Blepharisma stoltei]